VEREMRRYKRGTARSGRGGLAGRVKSRKQAIAIGLSKARQESTAEKNLSAHRFHSALIFQQKEVLSCRADGVTATGTYGAFRASGGALG
jgi:hypothetical protein